MEVDVIYYKWKRKEEKYEKDGKMLKAFKNIKEEINEDAKILMAKFEKDSCRCRVTVKKHVFNIKAQFRNFRKCLENLQSDEVVLVVDFSENYSCKYEKEIQGHHFVGSRNQVSFHTIVVYAKSNEQELYKTHSFCSVSVGNNHLPAAIWSHLDPILQWIKTHQKQVDTVHFFSEESKFLPPRK